MSDFQTELEQIAEQAHQSFESRTKTRDEALQISRTLIRHCSKAIRAVHREEDEEASKQLTLAGELADSLKANLETFPDIYSAGYTQDALKEFAEASIVRAMVLGNGLPTPADLHLEFNTYLKGLAEAASEMRRHCLDLMRQGHTAKAEGYLDKMDDVYGILVTMDYPDAITGGLRRLTDLVRGVTERTRGDLTLTLRQEQLEKSLSALEEKLK